MNEYVDELSRILREILAAGSSRDWDKMIELAKELEQLAMACRKAATDPGANEHPGDGGGRNRRKEG